MKCLVSLSSTLPLLTGLLLSGASLAAGPWEPLFNGKDLTGWKVLNGNSPYTVIGDSIVGVTIEDSPNSFLATERVFGDFIFECEVLQEGEGSNSGVQFRGLSVPEYMNNRVHGYQFEIDPGSRAWTGGIYDEARRGWLYPVTLNPPARSAYLKGQWNHIRIEAIGSSIRTWVNGIPVAHVIDDMTAEGFFALQVHSISRPSAAGRRLYWRNLRVQTTDLQPAPPDDIFVRNMIVNNVSEVEKARGWRLLWDGESTQGWRGATAPAFPAAGWKIADGVLTAEGSNGGDIMTTEEFSAFELQLDFRLTEGANSGIKYFVAPSSNGPVGLEYQLLDDARHPDAKLGAAGNRTLASLYDLIPRDRMPGGANIVPRVGQWQHARILVQADGQVEHWLNGIKVVEYERGSPLFHALIARSKYAEIPEFGLAEQGPILLQDHGNVVDFRSIRIRPIGE